MSSQKVAELQVVKLLQSWLRVYIAERDKEPFVSEERARNNLALRMAAQVHYDHFRSETDKLLKEMEK